MSQAAASHVKSTPRWASTPCLQPSRGMIISTMIGHPTSTIRRRTAAKEKKSFTLSRSSVAFLKRLRQERNALSTSLVLDQLIQEADASQRRNSRLNKRSQPITTGSRTKRKGSTRLGASSLLRN